MKRFLLNLPIIRGIRKRVDFLYGEMHKINKRLDGHDHTLIKDSRRTDVAVKQVDNATQLLEYRIDLIYKSLLDRMNAGPQHWLFPQDGTWEKALYTEAEALYIPGKFSSKDAPGDFDRSTTAASQYLDTHLRRFQASFAIVKQAAPKTSETLKVLDLGAETVYVNELRRNLPGADLTFVGTKPNAASADKWFDLQLETETLPFADQSFDLVVMLGVLERFKHDPMHSLAEANRVLRKDGRLVLSTPNVASWRAVTAVLTGYSPLSYDKYDPTNNRNNVAREYTAREVQGLLKHAGFDVEVWTENVFHTGNGTTASQILKNLNLDLKNRGDTVFCVGSKIGGL